MTANLLELDSLVVDNLCNLYLSNSKIVICPHYATVLGWAVIFYVHYQLQLAIKNTKRRLLPNSGRHITTKFDKIIALGFEETEIRQVFHLQEKKYIICTWFCQEVHKHVLVFLTLDLYPDNQPAAFYKQVMALQNYNKK